jgi:hypothetical protein
MIKARVYPVFVKPLSYRRLVTTQFFRYFVLVETILVLQRTKDILILPRMITVVFIS